MPISTPFPNGYNRADVGIRPYSKNAKSSENVKIFLYIWKNLC